MGLSSAHMGVFTRVMSVNADNESSKLEKDNESSGFSKASLRTLPRCQTQGRRTYPLQGTKTQAAPGLNESGLKSQS